VPRGELRRDARLTAQDLTELRSAEPPPPGIDWKLTVGVAATDAENGNARWSTPFQLRALFNEGRTAFKLSGDGFSRERSIDGTASGLNDLNATLTQALAEGFLGEIGVTVPSGGDAGSSAGRERLGAIYNRSLSRRWDGQIQARLVRFEADPQPGVSRIRRQGLVQLAYNFDAPRTVMVFQLLRYYRPGVGALSQAVVAYEAPLQEKKRPPVGAISFTRGLSVGARDDTLEFDVSFRF
jgi:hypothetical protein